MKIVDELLRASQSLFKRGWKCVGYVDSKEDDFSAGSFQQVAQLRASVREETKFRACVCLGVFYWAPALFV